MNDATENQPMADANSVLRTPYPVLQRVFRLARKELREILRDRRTIVTLIAMPLLIYPLMSVVFLQFSLMTQTGPDSGPRYVFAAPTHAEEAAFRRRVEEGEIALRRARAQAAARSKPEEKPPPAPEFLPYLDGHQRPRTPQERQATLARLEEALKEKAIHLIVIIPDVEPGDLLENPRAVDRSARCQVVGLASSPTAQAATAYIQTLFAAANEVDLKARLGAPDVKPRIMMLNLERVVLDGPVEDPLAALVPLILILMTITGAVYPAIDLTAGERERGTLEILVAAPVARFELLTAKYLSVLTVAMLTALVNLICMTITVTWSGLFQARPLTPILLLEILGLLLLFAAFFSAVLLCVTSFARSFKEAQAYLIPLMLASLTPGVVAMMPGLKLEGVLAVLPLVNIVLMARDLFESGVEPLVALIVVVTTLLYALASLALAARVFGAESVLYSEQSSWADLLSRPGERQPTATIAAALWCLALMVPIHFSLSALAPALRPPPALTIVLLVGINLVLFGAFPALFLYLGRVDPYRGLGLSPPRPAALVASLFLGASLWPIEFWLLSQSETLRALKERLGADAVMNTINEARETLGWGVLAVVIVPAILEELFFRGLLFNALKRRSGALVTIGVTALLFGVTHLAFGGPLGAIRVAPSLGLGLVLSAVCWRAGSVWPSVILHVCHNTIVLAVGIANPTGSDEVPIQWLAYGGAGAVFGTVVMWFWGGLQPRSYAP